MVAIATDKLVPISNSDFYDIVLCYWVNYKFLLRY